MEEIFNHNRGYIFLLCGWSHGVMVSTLDFESSDPSSNLGWTFAFNLLNCHFDHLNGIYYRSRGPSACKGQKAALQGTDCSALDALSPRPPLEPHTFIQL